MNPMINFSRLSSRTVLFALLPATLALGAAAVSPHAPSPPNPLSQTSLGRRGAVDKKILPSPPKNEGTGRGVGGEVIAFTGEWQKSYPLKEGQTVEISVHLDKPSALPPNARIAADWTLDGQIMDTNAPKRPEPDFGIAASLTPESWRKILHALDNDVYLVYRAPKTGKYLLTLSAVTNEASIGATERWREKGNAPLLTDLPSETPYPAATKTPISVMVRPIDTGSLAQQNNIRTIIETEPNDTPEMAQPITLAPGGKDEVKTYEITGGADDVEFFDNGRVGKSGDDWFRLDYKGKDTQMLTAQLSMPGQMLAARIRAYRLKPQTGGANPNHYLSIEEYGEGRDANERVHQQDEEHRANIVRTLKPGETYFLRVEANSPGYQLQLRVLRPAPYLDNPKLAVRQAIYTHIGQVDAWITNRPRGISQDRRVRDTGNLLGTQCMSCHTQSGVWGPAVPFQYGYAPENKQNYWHLINVMYECLRPTNELKDAANNTSLAPLDIGDGPAGTRAAGFNIVNAERVYPPRKLHSRQQIKTANYVMLTADPGGINAAGPGSNIGRVIVWLMSTEILKTAWEKSGNPEYFRKMEEKAKSILGDTVQFTDDVALRLHYFNKIFPIAEYAKLVKKAEAQELALKKKVEPKPEEIEKFVTQVKEKLAEDERRLRAIQNGPNWQVVTVGV